VRTFNWSTARTGVNDLTPVTSIRSPEDERGHREEGAQMYDDSREESAQREWRGEEMMWLVLRWVAFIIFVGLVIITFVYE
jgi:hypothetical protein